MEVAEVKRKVHYALCYGLVAEEEARGVYKTLDDSIGLITESWNVISKRNQLINLRASD